MEDAKGRDRKRGQSDRMETAGEDEDDPGSKGKSTTEQCPGKDDGNWRNIQRIGKANGYQRSTCQGKVLRMWRDWAFQTRLS